MNLIDNATRFLFFTGKGGVGKTTIAAAIAVDLAARGLPVHLTTTDPAAHISVALGANVSGLKVGRIDPEAETAAYRKRVIERTGKGLDYQQQSGGDRRN
jgi:arsenite-transporting ATPase